MALDLRIDGVPFPGETLTGFYRYFDADTEIEGDSVLRWFRNSEVIHGETREHIVMNADLGSVLTFEVTPVSEVAFPPSTAVGMTRFVSTTPEVEFRGNGGPGGLGDEGVQPTVWYRADAGVQTAPSGRVTRWDSSLAGGSPAQVLNIGREPLLLPQFGPRNAPAIRFEGAQALEAPGFPLNRFTLFTVTSSQHPANTFERYLLGHSSASQLHSLLLGTLNGVHQAFLRGSGLSFSSVATLDGAPHTFVIERKIGNGGVGYVDGLRQGNFLQATSPANNSDWLIGAGFQTGAFYRGEVFEIILYPQGVGEVRRMIVEHYLAGRHGIPPAGQVIFQDWDSHGMDICGLGRSNSDRVESAEGTGPLGMRSPTALSRNDYLLWGHDSGEKFRLVPYDQNGFHFKLEHDWSIQITDGGDGDGVGLVDVTLRMSQLQLLATPSRWALLLTEGGSTQVIPATSYNPLEQLMIFPGIDLGTTRSLSFAIR